MKTLALLIFVGLILSLSVFGQTDSSASFWSSLKTNCGKAFAGQIVHAPENDSFRGKKLVMHIRECQSLRIRIPFFVGDDKSRTWVLRKIGGRIQLKHDHRHKDGKPDKITMYGGTASNSGSANRQVFPADQETQKMLPAAASNVWWIDLTKESFTYNLRRVGTDRFFSIKFDLTKEIDTPEAPWGWKDLPPIRLTKIGAQDRYPSFSPDGREILFESNRSGSWDIYAFKPDGSGLRAVTRSGSNNRYPVWFGSGNRVGFVLTHGKMSALFEVASEGVKPKHIKTFEKRILFPVWSPDGNMIAFTADLDIFLKRMGSANPTRFVSTQFREVWLRWSPDGKKVAFFSRRDTNDQDDEIYIMDYPNGTPKRITNRMGHDFCPSWSPDGKRLAVAAVDEELGRSINIIDLEGNILSRHGLGFERVTEPNWSPDGKKLIYTARKDGNYDIYVERID